MWLVFILACNRSPSNAEKVWKYDFDNVRSKSVFTRANAARAMVFRCCNPDFLKEYNHGYRGAACQEVRRLIETETEPAVIAELIVLQVERPHCYQQFPSSMIVRLCRSGCFDDTRDKLITMLGVLDPSPEIVDALLHQLTLPVDETLPTQSEMALGHRLWSPTDADIDLSVALALGDMGEPDLWPVLDALASPNPRVRSGAMLAFYWALHDGETAKAPLDMPTIVPALEKLETDADPDTAYGARQALRAYRRWEGVSADDAVAKILRLHVDHDLGGKKLAIRMLAVRRFSCRTTAAADALAKLSADPDANVAAAARHASAFRAERCLRLQATDLEQ